MTIANPRRVNKNLRRERVFWRRLWSVVSSGFMISALSEKFKTTFAIEGQFAFVYGETTRGRSNRILPPGPFQPTILATLVLRATIDSVTSNKSATNNNDHQT